jgi:hypothetical protein
MKALKVQGIGRCNIFVANDNQTGLAFWKHMGWTVLDDTYRTMQKPTRSLAGLPAPKP